MGQPNVVWPEYLDSGYVEFAHAQMRSLAKAAHGGYRQPVALGRKSITVHPLGGCAMADDVEQGVTTDLGQVFAGQGTIHPGLYVADGAVIPTSLAANPFLTIAALSERTAEGIVNDPYWSGLFSATRRG